LKPDIEDRVRVRGNLIRGKCPNAGFDCTQYPYTKEVFLNISTPDNAMFPKVTILTSAILSSCDDIVIDTSSIAGSTGRPWVTVLWKVFNQENGAIVDEITDYLNAKFATLSNLPATVTIPNKIIDVGTTYDISLMLKNFFLKESTSIVSVRVSRNSNNPRVTIASHKA